VRVFEKKTKFTAEMLAQTFRGKKEEFGVSPSLMESFLLKYIHLCDLTSILGFDFSFLKFLGKNFKSSLTYL